MRRESATGTGFRLLTHQTLCSLGHTLTVSSSDSRRNNVSSLPQALSLSCLSHNSRGELLTRASTTMSADATKIKTFKCSSCDFKTSRRYLLNNHVRVKHTRLNLISCKQEGCQPTPVVGSKAGHRFGTTKESLPLYAQRTTKLEGQ